MGKTARVKIRIGRNEYIQRGLVNNEHIKNGVKVFKSTNTEHYLPVVSNGRDYIIDKKSPIHKSSSLIYRLKKYSLKRDYKTVQSVKQDIRDGNVEPKLKFFIFCEAAKKRCAVKDFRNVMNKENTPFDVDRLFCFASRGAEHRIQFKFYHSIENPSFVLDEQRIVAAQNGTIFTIKLTNQSVFGENYTKTLEIIINNVTHRYTFRVITLDMKEVLHLLLDINLIGFGNHLGLETLCDPYFVGVPDTDRDNLLGILLDMMDKSEELKDTDKDFIDKMVAGSPENLLMWIKFDTSKVLTTRYGYLYFSKMYWDLMLGMRDVLNVKNSSIDVF